MTLDITVGIFLRILEIWETWKIKETWETWKI